MRSILFVDDEPNVLSGLRRTLRPYRDEWEMEFASGGEEALQVLAAKSIDAVVTDMRMPGMDGAELLNRVRDEFPDVIRIMLSGQSDQESIHRSIGRTHQYYSKPCDPQQLYGAINRSCALRDRLSNVDLKQLIAQTTSLPSAPKIYTQVLKHLGEPDACVKTLSELIAQDVAMTAKLLQLVNSSYFGIKRRVESPMQAAALLGLNVLRPVILSVGIFSQFDAESTGSFSVDGFTNHSLAVGNLAEQIAKSVGASKQVSDDSLMAGLVHDVGQLLLASRLSAKYDEVLGTLALSGGTTCELETEKLGTDHAVAGAHLLGLWNLPQTIVEAVAFHHEPSDCPSDGFTPLTAVHVANALINNTPLHGPAADHAGVDQAYLQQLGLIDSLPQWKTIVDQAAPEGVGV